MNKTLRTGWFFQVIIITLFAGGVPLTAWAQTVSHDLSDYVGRPVNAVLEDFGVPATLEPAQPPALVLRYSGVEMHARTYDVNFAVTGPWVEVVRAAADDSASGTSQAINVPALATFMGKSRAEMVMLAGAPSERVAFEWEGFLLENMIFDVIMAGEPWRLICDLENDRVVTVTVQYGGEMAADEVRDFVLQLDARVLALLDEPVWCLDDAGYDATDPAENRWRYNRLAADERFAVLLQTRATPEMGHLFLDLTISALNARGFVARQFAVSHMQAIGDNWYKETSRYTNSGNTVRLKALLERENAR